MSPFARLFGATAGFLLALVAVLVGLTVIGVAFVYLLVALT